MAQRIAMTPKISIITPSYNQCQFIERTINSVLAQSVYDLQYLVIDGASTDETVKILRRYSDRFYWVSEKDLGHSHAINKGILLSKAPVIGWLNSDDIYYPDALTVVLEYFNTHQEIDVVYGNANHIDSDDNFMEKYPTENWDWERLKITCYISQPATFIRRSVFDRFGFMDMHLKQSMDYEFWLRIGKSGVRFAHIPYLLAATRLHSNAFTISSKVACHKAINDITRQHLGATPDAWIFNYAHAVADTRGVRRSDRIRYAVAISVLSWYAALRWNKKISRSVLWTTIRWMAANTRNVIREKLSR